MWQNYVNCWSKKTLRLHNTLFVDHENGGVSLPIIQEEAFMSDKPSIEKYSFGVSTNMPVESGSPNLVLSHELFQVKISESTLKKNKEDA